MHEKRMHPPPHPTPTTHEATTHTKSMSLNIIIRKACEQFDKALIRFQERHFHPYVDHLAYFVISVQLKGY